MEIEFLDYDTTGCEWCMCNGILTLRINGGKRVFGGEGNEASFWGRPPLDYEAPWFVFSHELPDDLAPYVEELEKILNENLPEGCCGGCE